LEEPTRNQVALGIAKISIQRGENDAARTLLREALQHFAELDELSQGLNLTIALNDLVLESAFGNKLCKIFPESEEAISWQMNVHLNNRDYVAAAKQAARSEELKPMAPLFALLADFLQHDGDPDYPNVVKEAEKLGNEFADHARVICIRHALSKNQPEWVLKLLISDRQPDQLSRAEVLFLLNAVEQLITAGAIDAYTTAKAVQAAIRYVATNPQDVPIRSEILRLVSAKISAVRGLSAVATTVTLLMERALTVTAGRKRPEAILDLTKSKSAELEKASDWLEAQSPIIPGRTKLPEHLVIQPVDEVVESLVEVLQAEQNTLYDEGARKASQLMLILGLSMSAYTKDPDRDLDLLRAAAAQNALAGRKQDARDLAETALTLSGERIERIRKAWVTLSDIYVRTRNPLDGLIYLGCALSLDCEVDIDDAFLEQYTLSRCFRDIGFTDVARQAVNNARRILTEFGQLDRGRLRLDLMEANLDWIDVMKDGFLEQEHVDSLFEKAIAVYDQAQAIGDDLVPVISLIAQAVGWADTNGAIVPDRARQLLDELKLNHTAITKALTSSVVRPDDLARAIRDKQPALYADDLAFDVIEIELLARKVLRADPLPAPNEVATAIEVLSERAIVAASETPFDFEKAGETAQSISTSGLDVFMAGLDSGLNLVTMTVRGAVLGIPRREPTEMFSRERLRTWSHTYPYGYNPTPKTEDEAHARKEADRINPNDVFFDSTVGMELSEPFAGSTLIVSDTSVQRIPPNLWRNGFKFAGTGYAVAATPSLEWLSADISALENSNRTGVAAWIPDSENVSGALTLLTSGVADTLASFAINLNRNKYPPRMFDMELAVIGGHGGIDSRTNYFQHVTDEDELVLSVTHVAQRVRNIGIVVLFVCSSGRVDHQPVGHGTVSFAKHLLSSGCSAVVASPWSLDAAVAADWLPKFLSELGADKRVIDANFAANQFVAQRHSYEFRRYLAMNLYGNPFTKAPGIKTSQSGNKR
jgi:tetratricopeptide (TPR) repeat protein